MYHYACPQLPDDAAPAEDPNNKAERRFAKVFLDRWVARMWLRSATLRNQPKIWLAALSRLPRGVAGIPWPSTACPESCEGLTTAITNSGPQSRPMTS